MDLASLLQGSVPKSYTETYGKRSAPLSPPAEEPKCSLPSISTLLEGADDHAAKRQRLSPQRDHAVQYDVRLPPTPPLRPGSGSGHASPSSKDHRSSISSINSINSNPQMGPYASPAPSVSSYSSHTSPVEAQPPTTTMYYRPPSTTTFAPSPIHQPAQSPSLISPVTPAWQHHHYFPPPAQLHTNKTTIATSAAPATRLSRVLPRCASTPTATRARSPSAAHTPAAERLSPCAAT
ncbi:uncharacterized protein N7443_006372 [Penicillium atrosanguineum]|uniref:uncharacterized protein n=1 Tax=Penicillium atrosanguineum TaxID=1132637 RepID=UPI00238DAC87|nr:uncharacterized protein N7443_006372 [Penicillium atrosanguineum]KAJ5298252.1 hypothetical protein N7443_006372 [Penicillium atrosanguineum]